MNEWVALGKRFRIMMQIRGITGEVLSKRTYIPERVLPMLVDGQFTATPECWGKIRKALNWPIWLDGLLDAIIEATYGQEPPTIAIWNKLTAAQKPSNAASDFQPPTQAQEPHSSLRDAAPDLPKEGEDKPKHRGRPLKIRDYVGEALREARREGVPSRTEADELSSVAENGTIAGRVLG